MVEQRHGRQVERVARVCLERADAALAQDDVRVAGRNDVLGRHQPLLDRGAVAALEHDRPTRLPDRRQERVVLHVARANLEDVRMLGDDFDLTRLHHFGDGRQTGFLAGFGQIPKAFDAEALEAVRAGSRLVGAPAQDRGAGLRHRSRRLEHHLAVLDGAGARHDGQRPVAYLASQDLDDGVFGVRLSRSQLVGLGDCRHGFDARHGRQLAHQYVPHRRDVT